MTVISSRALCAVLGISTVEWATLRKVCAPELRGIERPRLKRGRTPVFWPLPAVVRFFDRAMPEPLSSDTIRRLYEQSEPL